MALSGGLRCCRRVLSWVPVLVIVLVVLWSYYAYVFELCLVTVLSPAEKVIYLILYHAIFVFFAWTYWKSIFTLPQQPNQKFHLSYTDKERYKNEERPEVQKQMLVDMAKKLPVYTRTGSGAVRFCDRCHLIKPDRCHHCSVCAMCVLKMDHHCPWVNNCIGFSNYKFFLQFLAYSVLYCLYIATTVFSYFIKYWRTMLALTSQRPTSICLPSTGTKGLLHRMRNTVHFTSAGELPSVRSKFHVLFLLFVACMFFVSLVILFGYHCWLVSRNKTTLEAFCTPVFTSGPEKNGFNLGFIKNIQQVFGDNKKFWLIPIGSSPGDGHSFPMRSMNESQNPLLANEEPWEDNEDDSQGLSRRLVITCCGVRNIAVFTFSVSLTGEPPSLMRLTDFNIENHSNPQTKSPFWIDSFAVWVFHHTLVVQIFQDFANLLC
ncbi:Palmitoyltransferase ZDHHC15 [Apodemus speciosus]|uniref:Palmitoyltransferase n=1 Tax=Apodemus speciosus TaxID=105296 RepID=A0ABQ0FUZ6_APOSI